MKAIISLLLWCVLPAISVNGQDSALDSLRSLLKKTTNDTARIGLYVEMTFSAQDSSAVMFSDTANALINALMGKAIGKTRTELHRYYGQSLYARSMFFANAEAYDTALHYLDQAMEHALISKDPLQEARILNDKGVCFFRKNEVVKSIGLFTKSLAIREGLNDDEQLRNAYNNVAFIYKETGLIDQSLELNFKALDLAEKNKSLKDAALSLNNIGQLYHKYLMDRSKALEYYKKSLAIAERGEDKRAIGLVKNNIGALLAEAGNYPEAIRWYTASLALRREINYKFGIVNTLSNLAYNYLKTGLFDKARASLDEAMELNKSLRDKSLQTSVHRNYAELYKALNQTDSALYHATLAHDLNLGFGNPLNISGSAALLSGLYEKKGNYTEALRFYKLHKTMQDSVSNDDLKKEGIKSDIEYQYLKQKTENDTAHRRQLDKRNLYALLLIVLLVISVVIAFGLYKRNRLRQQLKEVEIRNKIAADLHDDVGSTLSSIRMYSDIVKQQPNHTDTSIQLLDKICNNSKETIETMSDIVWMIKPGNDAFANIEDRMLNFANEICTPAGINFEFEKNDPLDNLKISMEHRRDIYLIFKEAINNAVKYARCHAVRTAILLDKSSLIINISDDGVGFDSGLSNTGNGLSNMKKRTLAHGGTCTVRSAEGEGTEIAIVFPLK